jgi:hypothetical protein
MANDTIWGNREETFASLIPTDIEIVSEGTGQIWTRKRPTYANPGEPQFYLAQLDCRGERQALPRGSSPLMAFGGKSICGQEFLAEEVENYLKVYGFDRNDICVFENTRPLND